MNELPIGGAVELIVWAWLRSSRQCGRYADQKGGDEGKGAHVQTRSGSVQEHALPRDGRSPAPFAALSVIYSPALVFP